MKDREVAYPSDKHHSNNTINEELKKTHTYRSLRSLSSVIAICS
jgi:hypothetical protein